MSKQKHFYLFRGLIREARHWGEFITHLQESFPESKITTIDIPGAGAFYKSPSPLSISAMVESMRQVYLKQRAEGEASVLVAVSLGGMISSAWMKMHPQDFKEAIFINTSFGGFSPLHHRLRPSALLHLLKVPFLKGADKEGHILKLISNHESVYESTLSLWTKISQDAPVSLPNTIRQLLAGARFNVGDFRPEIPLLILASTSDRMVSVECSRKIAKAWNVPIIEHPTAGHDLTADDSEWTAQNIKAWLTRSQARD
jgi:alpha-beta hydrolase superfamily lysophospholipase